MENSAQNLGQELQSRREQLGYSLKDVAEHTRIRKVYLESMEQGQFEALPGQAYVTGFVRVYARHLGLDSDELLARLNAPQEGDQAQLPDSNPDDKAADTAEAQPPSGRGWGAFVLGFVVVLALGAAAHPTTSSHSRCKPGTRGPGWSISGSLACRPPEGRGGEKDAVATVSPSTLT